MSIPPAATWKAQPVDGVAAPVAPADLAQFQRASPDPRPVLRRRRRPADRAVRLSRRHSITGAKQVTLELGGTTVTYAHGSAARDPDHLAGTEPA